MNLLETSRTVQGMQQKPRTIRQVTVPRKWAFNKRKKQSAIVGFTYITGHPKFTFSGHFTESNIELLLD